MTTLLQGVNLQTQNIIIKILTKKLALHDFKANASKIPIHYRFVGCLEIPDWYRKRKVTLESRQGVAVKYLPTA